MCDSGFQLLKLQVVGPGLAEGITDGEAEAEGEGVSDDAGDWHKPAWNEATDIIATTVMYFFMLGWVEVSPRRHFTVRMR